MKLRSYFFGALACLALASCSSDDDAVASGEEKFDPSKTHYVAINIVNPTETRATGGDFVNGSDAENYIQKATLVFYDNSGNYITHVSTGHKGENINEWQTDPSEETTPAVEKITKAVCVLKDLDTEPSYVLAVLNTDIPDVKYITKGDAKANMTSLKAHLGKNGYGSHSSGEFVMTNSVYKDDGGNNKCEVALTSDNIQTAEAQALLNPVVIYVERVLARVDLRYADGGFSVTPTNKDVGIAQTPTVITPVIKGYGLVATNPDSYLFKNLGTTTWSWTEWSSPTNYRSYWAVSARPEGSAPGYGFNYSSWEDIEDANDALPAFGETAIKTYCHENTNNGADETGFSFSAQGAAPQQATTLVVAAELQAGGTAIDLIKYAGAYYTKSDYFIVIEDYLNNKGYKYLKAGTPANDWRNVLEVVQTGTSGAKAYKVKPAIKAGTAFDTGIEAAVNTALEGLGEAWYWNQGKAYYFVTIEHFGNPDCLYGVVRNHIYDITIKGVTGLGTPVADPEEDIIPEKPAEDEESHVAAQIKVLKWKIVRQHDVVLQ